jgi:hypothetical protein
MLMLDLCSGLGGASRAMKQRGWQVVTLDIDPRFAPDVLADLREWSWPGERPDLIWASPPCTEFARESMPWSRTGNTPDMSIVNACRRIIAECDPRYWILENVRGAVPYLGKPSSIVGPFFLWGVFPPLGRIAVNWRKKESFSSKQRAERAMIPRQLSLAVALAVEGQSMLPFPNTITASRIWPPAWSGRRRRRAARRRPMCGG